MEDAKDPDLILKTPESPLLRGQPNIIQVQHSPAPSTASYGSFSEVPPMSTPVRGRSIEPSGASLSHKIINPIELKRTKVTLLISFVAALVFAILEAAGGIWSGSFSTCVQAAIVFVFVARLLIMIFVLNTTETSAARLDSFRKQKPALYASALFVLISTGWLGGVVHSIVEVLSAQKPWHIIRQNIVFIVAASVALVFSIICGLVIEGGYLATKGTTVYPDKPPDVRTKSKKRRSTGIGYELITFARERALFLRRTLLHVNIEAQTWALVWFVVQCLLQLALAILGFVGVFTPAWAMHIDCYLALMFVPLALILIALLATDTFNLLMEGVLQGLDLMEVSNRLLAIDGVIGVRHLRIWSLAMDSVSLSVTLAVDPSHDVDNTVKQAAKDLSDRFDVSEFDPDNDMLIRRRSSRFDGLLMFHKEENFDQKRSVWLEATDLVKYRYRISRQVINVTIEGNEADANNKDKQPMHYQAIAIR